MIDQPADSHSTAAPQTENLPCPFCGGKPYVNRTVNGTEMFHVGCSSCGFMLKAAWYRGEDKPTKDILALWNQRAAASRRSSQGWLPIETMPREGYFIILWDNGRSSRIRWNYTWDCWANIKAYVAEPHRVPGWWLTTEALPQPPEDGQQ